MNKQPKIIIDSNMDLKKALAQNPQSAAPLDILDKLQILTVEYTGFDGLMHRGQIVIHEKTADDVKRFFDLALEIGFPIQSVVPISDPRYKWSDEISCGKNNSSGFNYRCISGDPSRLSNHARGFAFDINPVENIYVRYDKNQKEVFRFPPTGIYDKNAKGTLKPDSPLVALMKKLGWDWGGDWTPESGRIDYQHFEKIS